MYLSLGLTKIPEIYSFITVRWQTWNWNRPLLDPNSTIHQCSESVEEMNCSNELSHLAALKKNSVALICRVSPLQVVGEPSGRGGRRWNWMGTVDRERVVGCLVWSVTVILMHQVQFFRTPFLCRGSQKYLINSITQKNYPKVLKDIIRKILTFYSLKWRMPMNLLSLDKNGSLQEPLMLQHLKGCDNTK